MKILVGRGKRNMHRLGSGRMSRDFVEDGSWGRKISSKKEHIVESYQEKTKNKKKKKKKKMRKEMVRRNITGRELSLVETRWGSLYPDLRR